MCHSELGEIHRAHSSRSQTWKQKPALYPNLDMDFNRDLPLSMNWDELPSSICTQQVGALSALSLGSVLLCIETEGSLNNSKKWLSRMSLTCWLGHLPPAAEVILYARDKVLTQASFTWWRRGGDLELPWPSLEGRGLQGQLWKRKMCVCHQETCVL